MSIRLTPKLSLSWSSECFTLNEEGTTSILAAIREQAAIFGLPKGS